MTGRARGRRSGGAWLVAVGLATASGCTIAPKSFLRHEDPAPIVRARSLGMGRDLPESYVIPTLIGKLDDEDAVVRMTAHEELKRRTGRDFHFLPWAGPAERAPAVASWRNWWTTRRAELSRIGGLAAGRQSARPVAGVQTAPQTRRERRAAARARRFDRR